MKTCEICKFEYSQNIKYCPNCGTKNSSFKESDQIVNDFKKSIEKNSYFKVKVENEKLLIVLEALQLKKALKIMMLQKMKQLLYVQIAVQKMIKTQIFASTVVRI